MSRDDMRASSWASSMICWSRSSRRGSPSKSLLAGGGRRRPGAEPAGLARRRGADEPEPAGAAGAVRSRGRQGGRPPVGEVLDQLRHGRGVSAHEAVDLGQGRLDERCQLGLVARVHLDAQLTPGVTGAGGGHDLHGQKPRAGLRELPGRDLDEDVGDDGEADSTRVHHGLQEDDPAVEQPVDPVPHDPVRHAAQTTRHVAGRHASVLLQQLDDPAIEFVERDHTPTSTRHDTRRPGAAVDGGATTPEGGTRAGPALQSDRRSRRVVTRRADRSAGPAQGRGMAMSVGQSWSGSPGTALHSTLSSGCQSLVTFGTVSNDRVLRVLVL